MKRIDITYRNLYDDYNDILAKLEEYEDVATNLYLYDNHILRIVIDEDGRKRKMAYVPYQKLNVGFEIELYLGDEDELYDMKRGYHNGSRNVYRGGKEIFSTVERDGSLDENGYEFITKRHKANDKRFYYWFNVFMRKLEKYDPYINDDCGGHMHISGWMFDEYKYVFGSLRAFEPMLIGIFGNGTDGIMRQNGYSGIAPIIHDGGYGRSNIYRINNEHFELRFFDSELSPYRWFLRELFVDGIVHVARNVGLKGIGRYVSVVDWFKMYIKIRYNNGVDGQALKNMKNEFLSLIKESNYPNADLIEAYLNGEFTIREFNEYVKLKNGRIIISMAL